MNSELLPGLTLDEVKSLESGCISLAGFHQPDVIVLDTFCGEDVVGKEVDAWAERLARARSAGGVS